MAQIRVDEKTGHPFCPGCQQRYEVLPYGLASHDSGEKFGPGARRQGTSAGQVAAFAEKHATCPEPGAPRYEVSARGVVVIDRRRWSDTDG